MKGKKRSLKKDYLKKEYRKTLAFLSIFIIVLFMIPIIYIANPVYETGISVKLNTLPIKQFIYIHLSYIDVLVKPPFISNNSYVMIKVIVYPYNSTTPIYNKTLAVFKPLPGIIPTIDRTLILPVKPSTKGYSIRLWDNFTRVSIPVAFIFYNGPRFHTYPGSSFYRAKLTVALINKGLIIEKKGQPGLDVYYNITNMDDTHTVGHIVIGPGDDNISIPNTKYYIRVSLTAYHLFFVIKSKLEDDELVVDARSNWALLLLLSIALFIGIYLSYGKYKKLSRLLRNIHK